MPLITLNDSVARKCKFCVCVEVMMMMNCFLWYLLTDERHLALFPARTIVRDPHHRESPTRHEQELSLHRTWVQAELNEVV